MEETIRKELKNYLETDEKILWHGKTQMFPLLAEDAGGLILAKWLCVIVAAATIVTLYVRETPEWHFGVVVLILVTAICLMVSPIVERQNLLHQQYWITDRRLVLRTRNGLFYSLALKDVGECRLLMGNSLVLGHGMDEGQGQLRWLACHPQTEVNCGESVDRVEGMVFYCVNGAAEAQQLLQNIA